MFSSLKNLFEQLLTNGQPSTHNEQDVNLAIAALLCQVSQADHQIDEQEAQAQCHLLQQLLTINQTEAKQLIQQAESRSQHAASLYEFTDQLRQLSAQTRFELIHAMWQVAYADHQLDPIEEAIIRKAAELLYVSHSDFIRAKLAVINQ